MTKDELYDYIHTGSESEELYDLIAQVNGQIQEQLVSTFFKGSEAAYLAVDFIFDRLVYILAEGSGHLQHKPAEVILAGEDVYECPKCGYQSYKLEISVPMRKFIKSEPLTTQQFVIADVVCKLGNSNQKLAAIKLIRGTFLDDDGIFASVSDAKDIYEAIMARGE